LDLLLLPIRQVEGIALSTDHINLPGQERRKRVRFPMSAGLRYEIPGTRGGEPVKGTGQVLDISSRGIAFYADGPLERDQRLKVSMAWPAKLDNETTLRLVLEGVVLRTRGNLVVLSIERPEFRTAGKSAPIPVEEVVSLAMR
jgi:hypothetical protein